MLHHAVVEWSADRRSAQQPGQTAGGQRRARATDGLIRGERDGPGGVTERTGEVEAIAQPERQPHLVPVLGVQYLPGPPAHPVELRPRVEHEPVRGRQPSGDDRAPVTEVCDGERGDQLRIPQAAHAVLEIGFTPVRDHAGPLTPGHGGGHEIVEPGGDLVTPLAPGAVDHERAQVRVPGDHPGVQQTQSHRDVRSRHRETLVHGPDTVIQAHARVPQGVPHGVGEFTDVAVGSSLVHQHQVEVGVREHLAPAEPAEGHEGEPGPRSDPGLLREPSEFHLVQLAQCVPQVRRGEVGRRGREDLLASVPQRHGPLTVPRQAHVVPLSLMNVSPDCRPRVTSWRPRCFASVNACAPPPRSTVRQGK